ncbi:hypothetical protein S40293_03281 [Stachybotrys chartarum IBT 40293]|nr:hypothetical protein S40293_03281 [Stachybotrys chartarum IBT 40293]
MRATSFLHILVFVGLTPSGIHAHDARHIAAELSPQLSRRNLISFEAPVRWTTYDPPKPAVIVNVVNEQDVAITVKYATSNNIPFLAQNGGNGWATTFNLGPNGILINLASLNQVTFNADKTRATIGGGSNINNTIARASAAGALVTTGNCNCVGTLGAMLGGGYGNLLGVHGFGVDNIVSLRVVTADGRIRTVSATSEPDLFWGLRGAGPNLGIVTSAVVRSYPAQQSDLQAWAGSLVFTPDKLEQVVQAVQEFQFKPTTVVFMYFVGGGPPSNEPVILITPFMYKGTPETGRAAYAKFYDIGPVAEDTAVIPWTRWNTGGDAFCTPGARKPSFGAGIQKMIPSVWRQVWHRYVDFQQQPGAENSAILLEAYSLVKAQSINANTAAFPHRNVKFNAVIIGWYEDKALDRLALSFGQAARDLLRASDGLHQNSTYINFAHGDEDLTEVYGHSLPRLRSVKQRYDPRNHFDQWFNIE